MSSSVSELPDPCSFLIRDDNSVDNYGCCSECSKRAGVPRCTTFRYFMSKDCAPITHQSKSVTYRCCGTTDSQWIYSSAKNTRCNHWMTITDPEYNKRCCEIARKAVENNRLVGTCACVTMHAYIELYNELPVKPTLDFWGL